jgi:hypothetical protein
MSSAVVRAVMAAENPRDILKRLGRDLSVRMDIYERTHGETEFLATKVRRYDIEVEILRSNYNEEDAEWDALTEKLTDWLKGTTEGIEREMLDSLVKEYEYLTSDESVIESLSANEMYFDDEGHPVNMSGFVHMDQLPKPVAAKVLKFYARTFGRSEQEVLDALVRAEAKFDKRGNRIDTEDFKTVDQLTPRVMEKVLEKYRNWNVEDSAWSDSIEEYFRDEILKGWKEPTFEWQLWVQGHGVNVYSDSIDLKEFVKAEEERQLAKKNKQAQESISLAAQLLNAT